MARARGRQLLAVGVLAVALAGCSSPTADPAAEPRAKPAPSERAEGVVITPSGVAAPRLSSFDGGYWVRTPCFGVAPVHGGRLVTSADIVLDPGHGGTEPGALAPNGEPEKGPNLEVSRRVATRLRELGISVVLTRTTDVSFMTLRTRAEIATALHPTAFLAIHHNAGTTDLSDRPGTEAYHQLASEDGRRLAQAVYDEVSTTFPAIRGRGTTRTRA